MLLTPDPKGYKMTKNAETMKQEIDWWSTAKVLLNDMKFVQKLQDFDKDGVDEKVIVNLGKFINDPASAEWLELDKVKSSSQACFGLIQWVQGIYQFYWVNKDIKPLKA